jgi:hypothetical protein
VRVEAGDNQTWKISVNDWLEAADEDRPRLIALVARRATEAITAVVGERPALASALAPIAEALALDPSTRSARLRGARAGVESAEGPLLTDDLFEPAGSGIGVTDPAAFAEVLAHEAVVNACAAMDLIDDRWRSCHALRHAAQHGCRVAYYLELARGRDESAAGAAAGAERDIQLAALSGARRAPAGRERDAPRRPS